jgi:hypothetical protein
MKYQLNIRLIACGKSMLAEIANDIETKKAEDMNYTSTFDDGGYIKCVTDIQIIGRDVTINAVFEGSGDMFEKKIKELEHQVKTRELQNSFKRNYDRYGPDNTCSRMVATFGLC